jgi:GT2 family glycosyltransferase
MATNPQPEPQVSVLVTTWNHARYVEEALDSLRRQTNRNFEVIITDDASIDGSAEIIAAWLARTGFAAQFIRNPHNRGICANCNAALARARGRFVCSLSGDDAYEPDRIARQLACFDTLPEQVAAVYSDALAVDAEGRPGSRSVLQTRLNGRPPPQGRVFEQILAGNFLPAPAVMVRKSAIAAVGGYDESLFYEDFDMWLRLAFRFHFIYLPGRLVRYRMLDHSMSNAPRFRSAMCRSRTRILRKWLEAGLEPRAHRLLMRRLLVNGALQLSVGDSAGAGDSFAAVASRDPRLHRRLLARAAMLPGAWLGPAALRLVYRGWKRLRRRAGVRG